MGIKISALPPQTTPDGADELPSNDVSATTTKKITLTVLKEWFQSLVGWITTAMIGDAQVTSSKIDFKTLNQNILPGAFSKTLMQMGSGNTAATSGFTTVHVTFPTAFPGTPIVLVSVNSTSSAVTYYTAAGADSTGFDFYINQSAATSRGFRWVAFYL